MTCNYDGVNENVNKFQNVWNYIEEHNEKIDQNRNNIKFLQKLWHCRYYYPALNIGTVKIGD
jgi:hypothetical protein